MKFSSPVLATANNATIVKTQDGKLGAICWTTVTNGALLAAISTGGTAAVVTHTTMK